VNSDLDKGIEKNLDAAFIQHKLNKAVKYEVKAALSHEAVKLTRKPRARRRKRFGPPFRTYSRLGSNSLKQAH
jgi:hypothetical protein